MLKVKGLRFKVENCGLRNVNGKSGGFLFNFLPLTFNLLPLTIYFELFVKHGGDMKKVFYFLLLVLPLLGAKLDVNTLNYEIQKKHYKWIAKENPVSRLSESDWKSLLGARIPKKIVRKNVLYPTHKAHPETLDWRNMNGAGNVYAYSSSGQVISSFPITTAGNATPPTIDDIDNDGDTEIVEGTNDGIYAIDYKTKTIRGNYWNMFRGNSRRTGYVSKSDFGIHEKKGGIFNYSVYPNPTSGKIHLILPSNTNVKVYIYDIVGRNVLTKGWNSRYNKRIFNLNKLHSGVYFMRIDSQNSSVIKKIILVK